MKAVYCISLLLVVCNAAHDDMFISKEDKGDLETIEKLVMRPRVPDRFLPDSYFEFFGKNPNSRLKAFSFKNCGDPSKETFKLMQLMVTPDPIVLPGEIGLSFALNNTEKDSSPIKLDLVVKKKILGLWVEIPCIDNIGSCSYQDVCELLDQVECPSSFQDHGINCRCPLPMGNFTLPETKFEVDVSNLPTGDYSGQVNFSFQSGSTACYQIDATLA